MRPHAEDPPLNSAQSHSHIPTYEVHQPTGPWRAVDMQPEQSSAIT